MSTSLRGNACRVRAAASSSPPTGCRHNRSPLFCPRYIYYYVYTHNVDSCKRRDVAFTIYTELFHSCRRKRVNSNEIKRDNLNPSTLEQVSFRSFILFSDENNKRFPMLCVFDWLCNVITSVTTSVLHHNPTKIKGEKVFSTRFR
jgi:hypothetical protein